MSNTKPNLSFRQMWNLSFGFFGVQIAYALQSANISRIFATLGADPHTLSFFWVLPPLMGMIVQPIVGSLSDKTWCRLGRRKPYLYVGSIVAVIVMALLPNSGSFNLTVKAALGFGAVMLMLLDTSINMAMQPFKMMVGDMVNEEQKTKAYSIQSLLCNAGSLVGYLFPYIFTWIGIKNTAPEGMIPPSVTWSFYIGAIILILCVLYTGATVKEMNPEEYAKFHNIEPVKAEAEEEKAGIVFLPEITIDDFFKVDLRVAEITACEPIKKAKKLLKLTLNDGTKEPRTVASGIAKWYKPEDLIGRRVVLVANLKPAVLCGVESQGMILAATDHTAEGEEDVKVLFVDGMTPGSAIH